MTDHTRPSTTNTRNRIKHVFDRATAGEAGWAISGAVALALIEVVTGLLEAVPPYLLPTVVALALTLLLAAGPLMSIVPERWRLCRQALRILAVLLVLNAVLITVSIEKITHRQDAQAAAACLTTMSRLEKHADSSARLTLSVGRALCEESAAEHG